MKEIEMEREEKEKTVVGPDITSVSSNFQSQHTVIRQNGRRAPKWINAPNNSAFASGNLKQIDACNLEACGVEL